MRVGERWEKERTGKKIQEGEEYNGDGRFGWRCGRASHV